MQMFAQGDLLITPKRVVFEGNKQKEELNLVNIGKDTAVYSISFVQYNMKENGTFQIINSPDSGQMFADPYLRIFPRKVTLAPREPQVISLQCRRKPGMLSGEYRSHLYFRSEKNNQPLGSKKNDTDSTQLRIELIPIYGISIPIIIRSGEVNVSSTLNNLRLETKQDTLSFLNLTINRMGNMSIYGDISVMYVPIQGQPYEIGRLTGIGVYTNINKRNISVQLMKTPGLTLKNGKLKVKYSDNDLQKKVYAEAELLLK
jgi:hypothetical protein